MLRNKENNIKRNQVPLNSLSPAAKPDCRLYFYAAAIF